MTFQRFSTDTKNHELTVLRDDPPYRHLRFGKPGDGCCAIEILTFPGYLVVVGDMGSFTFWRTADMFTFFRGEPGSINPHYWSEKVEAVDRHGGITVYSEEKFKQAVLEDARQYLELPDGAELPEDIQEALDRDVFRCDENEYAAREAVDLFEHEKLKFQDFWEHDLHEFRPRFLWICYAIVQVIALYDAREKTNV
jgi:hypothetical protein